MLLAGGDAAAGEDAAVPTQLLALARAGGEYPPGVLGDGALQAELHRLRGFATAVSAASASPALAPQLSRIEVALGAERWTLTAPFPSLRRDGLLRHRYDDTRPADYLAAWLMHLALCAAPVAGVACATRGLSRDGEFRFRAVDAGEAHRLLRDALALYREGLMRPLHFFPKSAWAYVTNGDSLAKAQARWMGGRPGHGEASDPAYRLALRGVAVPLDDSFRALATGVLGPLLQHLDDARL